MLERDQIGSRAVLAREIMRKALARANSWIEARYQKTSTFKLETTGGGLPRISNKVCEGIGIRALVNGTFGFASTVDITESSVMRAIREAEQMAACTGSFRKNPTRMDSRKRLARGDFFLGGVGELSLIPWEEKYGLIKGLDEKMRRSNFIESTMNFYTETFEERIVMTTDGADAYTCSVRPEIMLTAFAADGSRRVQHREAVGVIGAWDLLFKNRNGDQLAEETARHAGEIVKAEMVHGGAAKVILSPSMVGLLCHEAVGHTVEADFVIAGSIASRYLNQQIASELVSISDSGETGLEQGASGILPVDDEGVITRPVDIIKNGKLLNYLHSRQTAAEFGVEPMGNARSANFSDPPIVRMRNTYMHPGSDSLDAMIEGVQEGYFVDGFGGGKADVNGDFTFVANKVRRIRNGKLAETMSRVTVSGRAFDVLKTIDAVSSDFHWGLGAGGCGKSYQPIRVDGGGPYVRCQVMLGGKQ